MTFYAIQIEECPGFGWVSDPVFDTLIRVKQGGRNKRKPRRAIALHRYICPFNNIPLSAYRNIKRMHMAMWGSLHTFLHHDPLDDEATDEVFGTGDGITSIFQLKKTYDPGGGALYERDITKPDVDGDIRGPNGQAGYALVIMVDGVQTTATVDPLTGDVDFESSPPAFGATLTWSGKHYVPVRFNRDDLPFSIDDKNPTMVFITNGSLELIEELSE